MLYHLIHDDKFINIAYQQFEKVFPNENIFIYPYSNIPTKFITNISIKKYSTEQTIKFLNTNIRYSDLLIVHYLGISKINIINKIEKKCPIIWIGWGNDYYPLIVRNMNTLLFEGTKKLYLSGFSKTERLKNYIRIKFNPLSKLLLKVTEKIDYINTVIPDDYDLIKKNHPSFKPKYFSWNYGGISYLRPPDFQKSISKQNILLGNCATPYNNHVEIIHFLSTLSLNDRKVICPLSYGDEKYAKKIIQLGNVRLKENFLPLIKFLPLNEYYRSLSSCVTAFMNHSRQQALGNILSLMLMGCNIVLQKINPLYTFLVKNNFYVYSFNEVEKNPEIIFIPMCEEKMRHNISLIEEMWSDELIYYKTLNFKQLHEN